MERGAISIANALSSQAPGKAFNHGDTQGTE